MPTCARCGQWEPNLTLEFSSVRRTTVYTDASGTPVMQIRHVHAWGELVSPSGESPAVARRLQRALRPHERNGRDHGSPPSRGSASRDRADGRSHGPRRRERADLRHPVGDELRGVLHSGVRAVRVTDGAPPAARRWLVQSRYGTGLDTRRADECRLRRVIPRAVPSEGVRDHLRTRGLNSSLGAGGEGRVRTLAPWADPSHG